MKPAPFTYHDPRSLADVLNLLTRHENAKLIAGGQSLVPMLNMRFVIADHVIDLNRVEGLNYVRATDRAIEIGAMTRQRTLERDALVARRAPIIRETLAHVGHFQTRSRGTIGGSLCHLDPAAELAGIATLYGATLKVAGPSGQRNIAMADWGLGYMTPAVGADEVLTGITLPLWSEAHGHAFVEFARRHGDFAIAGVGCLLAVDPKGVINRAAIALIGIATAPVRMGETERAMIGQPANTETFKAAATKARTIEALSDAHVSASYRQRLAAVLVERALTIAAGRARGGSDVRH
jgi:aerobic carbon-monoxide dehydrogenase medium subunit